MESLRCILAVRQARTARADFSRHCRKAPARVKLEWNSKASRTKSKGGASAHTRREGYKIQHTEAQ